MASESFISEEVIINVETSEICLSRLFDWFSNDFGNSLEDVLLFILPFCKGKQKDDLISLMSDVNKIKVSYQHYDWNLNVGNTDAQEEFI